MMKRLSECFFGVLIICLGIAIGFSIGLISYSLDNQVDKDKIPYFYMGQKEELLKFKFYADSLYLPDRTIKSIPSGVVDSPQLAAEIGKAILNDIYGEDNMLNQYPYNVVERNSTWEIFGYMGYTGHIVITRSTGMVLFRDYWK